MQWCTQQIAKNLQKGKMFSISVILFVTSTSVMLTKANIMTANGVYPNALQPQSMMYGGGPFPYVLNNLAMSQNQPTLPYMPPPAMLRYPLPFQMPTDQTMNPYNPLNLLIQSAIVRLVMSLAIANTNLPLQTNTGPVMNHMVPTFQYPMTNNQQFQSQPEVQVNLNEEILKKHQQDANQQEEIINSNDEEVSNEEKLQNSSYDNEEIRNKEKPQNWSYDDEEIANEEKPENSSNDDVEENYEDYDLTDEENKALTQLRKDEEEIEQEKREAKEQIFQEQFNSLESDETYESPENNETEESSAGDNTFKTSIEHEIPIGDYTDENI